MPMWTCDIQGCQQPAVRTDGDCVLCDHHLCARHLAPESHQCPEWKDGKAYDPAAQEAERREMTQLIEKVNVSALVARATYIRNGISYSVRPLQYNSSTRSSVMGGMNYHIEIIFRDGVSWLARIRRFNATSPPTGVRDYIVQSEVATLRFLQKTNVPAPQVFDFALEGKDNPVGVGYILMEKMAGSSLQWASASPERRQKVMNQLVDVFIELRNYPFELIGSLDSINTAQIGSFARESLTDFAGSEMRPLSPFSSIEDYHHISIRLTLDLILREEIYTQRAEGDGRFYLKHADDKGDHILVDREYNITGIIDWERAHKTSIEVAFNSPIVLLPVSDFYDGVNAIGQDEAYFARVFEEKSHFDMADAVKKGRIQHRFAFCCGYDLADWNGFLGLFQGLRNALMVDEGLDWDSWKGTALHRYREEEGLKILLARDKSM